jgi:hypothetical protein
MANQGGYLQCDNCWRSLQSSDVAVSRTDCRHRSYDLCRDCADTQELTFVPVRADGQIVSFRVAPTSENPRSWF